MEKQEVRYLINEQVQNPPIYDKNDVKRKIVLR